MAYVDPSIRHWDPKQEFIGAGLKPYKHWVLEVSWQQHTLGCYIIFCRRKGVRRQSELTPSESTELIEVMREIETALCKCPLFKPDHFNYLQLGNVLPLLHFHGVPRYKKNRRFSKTLLDREITDIDPNYLPHWTTDSITKAQMRDLREEMWVAMGGKRIGMAKRENPLYQRIREALAIWW